jgi:hypothetical protein
MLRRAGFSTRPHRVLLAKETPLMTQNRITLTFPPADLAAIAAAIETLEDKFVNLVDLSVSERRHLVKMGDKSEAFCRQTLILLDQNRQMIPPSFDLDDDQGANRRRIADGFQRSEKSHRAN